MAPLDEWRMYHRTCSAVKRFFLVDERRSKVIIKNATIDQKLANVSLKLIFDVHMYYHRYILILTTLVLECLQDSLPSEARLYKLA